MKRKISSPQHLRSIGYSLIGYTMWVVTDSCLKLMVATPMPKYEILLFLNIGSVLTVIGASLLRKRQKYLILRKPLLSVTLSLLTLGTIVAMLISFQRLSLTLSYIIIFTGPMITALAAAIFLRERIDWIKGIMILVGFGGVVIALGPENLLAAKGDWIGYTGAFVSVLFYTAYVLLLRFHGESENPEALVLYPRLYIGLGCLLTCLIWKYVPITLAQVGLFAIAGIGAGLGWLFVTVASQRAPASIIAPYRYSQIITGAVFGYLIWQDVPSWNLAAGALIIILSGLYIANHTRKGAEMLEEKNI